MTGSLSIFLKVCPACAARVPTASDLCGCGHAFESTVANSLAPEEQTLRDEELYENYLVARFEQATQAALSAQEALMEDPGSNEKATEAELAREVAKSIGSDLAEQRAKIAALRRLVEVKRPKPALPALNSILVPAAVPEVAFQAAEPAAETTVSKPEQSREVVAEAVIPESAVTMVITPTPIKSSQPTTAPIHTSPAASARKAANVLGAIKQAKAREAAVQLRKTHKARTAPPATAVTAPVATAEPPIEVSSVPPPGFRQEQAARAELLMETRKHADSKDCPNCTSSVPTNTTRCSCGFAFIAGGSDLPSLTLCTGDFTALRNSLNLNLRRR